MNSIARSARPLIVTATMVAALVTACSPQPATGPAPGADVTAPPADGTPSQQPCVVGEWQLDVAMYRADSEAYVLGLPLPIEGFDMTGVGFITFTPDGLVTTDVDLTSSGTIVAGETRVPFSTPSRYAASGDWSLGGDGATIDLANWSSDVDHDVLADPSAPGVPAIDYTDIPSVTSQCSETELHLVVPGAPLSTTWYR